jgi:hypothetical protein
VESEASYVCNTCGEEIVIPVDPTAGPSQEFVEDCPVCCRPNVIRIEFDPEGTPYIRADAEQDEFG